MPLTGEALVGMPNWLGDAFTAVSKNFTEVEPQVQQIADLSIAFTNEKPSGELFKAPAAKSPGAELRRFTVLRTGDGENPDVELHFTAYCPFSRDFWKWLGEMAGEDVHMAFPASVGTTAVSKPQPSLIKEPTESTNDPSLADEFGAEYENQVRESMGAKEKGPRLERVAPHKKSGPKDLKSYHKKVTGSTARKANRSLAVN